jgi:hypothetical protein
MLFTYAAATEGCKDKAIADSNVICYPCIMCM